MNDLQGIWLLEAFRRGGVDTDELTERFPEPLRLMVRDPASVHPDDVNRVLRACQALSVICSARGSALPISSDAVRISLRAI